MSRGRVEFGSYADALWWGGGKSGPLGGVALWAPGLWLLEVLCLMSGDPSPPCRKPFQAELGGRGLAGRSLWGGGGRGVAVGHTGPRRVWNGLEPWWGPGRCP